MHRLFSSFLLVVSIFAPLLFIGANLAAAEDGMHGEVHECIEHCFEVVDAMEVVQVVAPEHVTVSMINVAVIQPTSFAVQVISPSTTQHRDPRQILTIEKRE